MSNITVKPALLSGTVTPPPSKSDVHRAILCAAMAKGKSKIHPIDFSKDITATINCVKALGAQVVTNGKTILVDGTNFLKKRSAILHCGESGSTLRFMIPIACAGGVKTTFLGDGRLPSRPIGIYLDCLPNHGITCNTRGGLPLDISGTLQSGVYEIAGDVSSQFITGLLLALPLLNGNSEIKLTSAAQSVGYIDMTISTMKQFGVNITKTKSGYYIQGNQEYKALDYTCEGDWSQAAFFFAAGALGGNVEIKGLKLPSLQGDSTCVNIFEKFGANVNVSQTSIYVSSNKLNAIDIDAENIPDLVPILAVTAALASGTTKIINAGRLRIKESDRLSAIANGLNTLGANVTQTNDGLIIKGVSSLNGSLVHGVNDHRIVMSLAIAAAKTNGDITITDKESIQKSYPNFFTDYEKLGGKIKE